MNLEDSLLNDMAKLKSAEKQESKPKKKQGLSTLASPILVNEQEVSTPEPTSGKLREKHTRNHSELPSLSTGQTSSGVSPASTTEHDEKLKML